MTPTQPPSSIVFEPIPFKRAFEEVCQRVRAQLTSGALKPGDKLPAERQMAEQLGVSRTAVREALRSLENAGVVVLRRGPKGGAFIRGGNSDKVSEVMSDMLNLGAVTLADLTEARTYILDIVVKLACERADSQDDAALEANLKRTGMALSADDYPERIASAMEFYRLLAAATRNPVLRMLVDSLTVAVLQVWTDSKYPADRLVASRIRFLRRFRERDSAAACEELGAHLKRLRAHAERQRRLNKGLAEGTPPA